MSVASDRGQAEILAHFPRAIVNLHDDRASPFLRVDLCGEQAGAHCDALLLGTALALDSELARP